MKPTTLLERQHANVRQLCETIEQGSTRLRESLLPQLASDLAAHIRVEEELFLPAIRGRPEGNERARAACDHLRAAREQLARLVQTPTDDDRFEAYASELRHIIDRLVEQEEKILFPLANRCFSPSESRALAERMMMLYEASVEAGYECLSATKPLVSPWRQPSPSVRPPAVAPGRG